MGFFSTCTIHCHITFSCPSECFIHLKLSNFPHFFWLASSRNYLCLPYLHYEGRIIDFNRLGRYVPHEWAKRWISLKKPIWNTGLWESLLPIYWPPPIHYINNALQLRGKKLFLLWKFMHIFCKPPSSLNHIGFLFGVLYNFMTRDRNPEYRD